MKAINSDFDIDPLMPSSARFRTLVRASVLSLPE